MPPSERPETKAYEFKTKATVSRKVVSMSSTAITILTSALVSGVVALGIEWVVKPRLEARKERIIGYWRKRHTFDSYLLKMLVISGRWSELKEPAEVSDDFRRKLSGEMDRDFGQIDDMTRELFDDIGSYALTYVGMKLPYIKRSIPDMIADYIYIVRGIAISDRAQHTKAEIIRELTEPTFNYLFGNRKHPVRRMRALFRLPQVLDKYSAAAGQVIRTEAPGTEAETASVVEDPSSNGPERKELPTRASSPDEPVASMAEAHSLSTDDRI
jgi:hypothetical protein